MSTAKPARHITFLIPPAPLPACQMRFRMDVYDPIYVDDATKYTNCYNDDTAIKNEYVQHTSYADGARVVYIFTCAPGDVLGWSTIPDMNGFTEPDSSVQATFLLDLSLPGSGGKYGEGDTAVHELGHYFGLYHTFQGGCLGGDLVEDTPAEDHPVYSCSEETDSCSNDDHVYFGPGVGSSDPKWNYMDYPEDDCMTRFTMGQALRMRMTTNLYKVRRRQWSTK